MAEITTRRVGELLRGVFEILLASPDGMAAGEVLGQVEKIVPPTEFEDSAYPKNPSVRRYGKIVRSSMIPTVKAGWLVKEKGVWFEETDKLDEVASKVDVLYVLRIQKERFPTKEDYMKLQGCYVVNNDILKLMKEKSIIMHCLPRVDEVSSDVDSDRRAIYFDQAENGLYVRMALLNMILGGMVTK